MNGAGTNRRATYSNISILRRGSDGIICCARSGDRQKSAFCAGARLCGAVLVHRVTIVSAGEAAAALLLQALYSIRSERLLMQRREYDRVFRRFVDIGAEDAATAACRQPAYRRGVTLDQDSRLPGQNQLPRSRPRWIDRFGALPGDRPLADRRGLSVGSRLSRPGRARRHNHRRRQPRRDRLLGDAGQRRPLFQCLHGLPHMGRLRQMGEISGDGFAERLDNAFARGHLYLSKRPQHHPQRQTEAFSIAC